MSIITATAPFRIVTINTASLGEFSDNTNSSFKNRLPRPIRMEGDWEVALDNIALPNATSFTGKLNPCNRTNLITTWFSRRDRNPGPGDSDTAYVLNFTKFDLEGITPTVDGIGFMKTVFGSLAKWRIEDVLDNDPRFSYTVNGKEQRTYWKWVWEGDELVSDNVDMYKTDPSTRPLFLIDLALGEKMGWFVYNDDSDQYDLGPNLKQELFDPNIVPEINGNPPGDVFEPYTSTHRNAGRRVFWTANDPNWGRTGVSSIRNYARLSFHCNWRFININTAFSNAVGPTQRSLLCYSDVTQPSVVGNQTTQLLREFYYEHGGKGRKTGSTYYEPHRRQYLPLRSNTVTVISTEIAEKSGELTKFVPGETTVTYHFRPVQ